MIHSPRRRSLLLAASVLPFIAPPVAAAGRRSAFALLESGSGGRLGVVALDTGSRASLEYRAGERFPFCSTFKMMLAAAVLKRSEAEPGLLEKTLGYAKTDLVAYSLVTEKHQVEGMSVAALCAAAVQYSDNTAANLLIGMLGGPSAVTAFARAIGDESFRLDRIETELNTAIPGDERDTTTPIAMARSLQKLALGDALAPAQRARLQDWLRGNTTGAKRIRAGVPEGWAVGDKTGSGDYGTTNDIAVLWPPGRAPIVLVVFFTQREQDAKHRDEVIVAATKAALAALG